MSIKHKQFYALVYKADGAFYQNGKSIAINCYHENHGSQWGVTTVGEIVQLPGSTETSPPTQTGMVSASTVYPDPTFFGDASFKAVTMVKDMVQLCTYYVDTDSYNTNVITCNS